MRLIRLVFVLAAAAIAAGCATPAAPPPDAAVLPSVTSFSESTPGTDLPKNWHPWSLNLLKPPSRYQLVQDEGGAIVVKALARGTASGLIHYLDVDPAATPFLAWRWKAMDLAPSEASADDSPVRVVVSFDGDLEKLPFGDRIFYNNFRLFTGQQLPYAALMYIWGSRTPKEQITPNRHTSRIKILVVENGREKLGTWQAISRNVREDFKRAFGEEPGKIISIGILTENEDPERAMEAYYGDLGFRSGCCHR
jgi:hypothetical protein